MAPAERVDRAGEEASGTGTLDDVVANVPSGIKTKRGRTTQSRYCPQCGTHLVVVPIEGKDRERCPACGFIAYRNPVPVGLAVIEHEGRLVLVRRRERPLAGYWAPPAGYVEVGESVPEAVVREAHEESGLTIALDALVGVYSQRDVDVVIIAYRGHSLGGVPAAGDDASEIGLFGPGELPKQLPPAGESPTDHWFYGVIREVTAPWE
ncbi:MAG: NUDIX hydrolase [Betaproteobacteria bacterium]|nr:NUDIX hydrolase [Betaproteobacteria bacterium]